MPEFDGQLQRSASNATLVSLDFSDGSQIKGIGIFESISGSTPPTRDGLPTANRSDGYIAIVKDVDKVYVFHGDPSTSWTNTSNWTEVGAGSGAEVNDLTAAVIWANVPNANITESSVTQHQAALTIAQSQVTGLTGVGGTLTSLQDQITLNDSDIATNAGGISANAQAIIALQTDVSLNDADIQQLQTDLAAEISATNSDVSNLQSQITSNDGDITSLQGNVSGIQTELNTTQTGAGLAVNGAYTQSQSSNYINSATTLFGADTLLDAQIKVNETNISTNTGNISSNSSAISTNATNISSNSASISVNATNIASNTSSISTNTGNIAILDTRVTAAEGDITTNANAIATKQDALVFGIANTNAVDIDSPSATISSGQYARFTANGLEGLSAANVLGDIGAASSVQLSAVSASVTTNAGNITANATDIATNAADIAANLAAIQSNDTDIANNATAISNEATARANADTALQGQITANAVDIAANVTAIAANTTHSGIVNGNPHGTSITNLVGVPPTLGSYKNVLTVNSGGTALEYSNLIEEITNEILDLININSSFTTLSADINGDGIVGSEDLLILLGQYGQTVSNAFTVSWFLNDSNSSLPYTGSSNESDNIDAPSDANTNLLTLELPSSVIAYTPWTITTNLNNETVTISQNNGDPAESVEYSKDLDFIESIKLEVQQTANTSNMYNVFLKAVYSYPTASDVTIWNNLGSFTHATANYETAGGVGSEYNITPSNIEDLFNHTSTGTSGDEYPSSVTMSFRYMKSTQEGDGYLRLKRVHVKWKS